MYDRPFPPPCRLWSVISILDLVVKRTPGMYANVCGFAWTAACLNPNGWKIPKTKTPKCQRNVVRGRCARSMLALRIHLFFCACFPSTTKRLVGASPGSYLCQQDAANHGANHQFEPGCAALRWQGRVCLETPRGLRRGRSRFRGSAHDRGLSHDDDSSIRICRCESRCDRLGRRGRRRSRRLESGG